MKKLRIKWRKREKEKPYNSKESVIGAGSTVTSLMTHNVPKIKKTKNYYDKKEENDYKKKKF